MALKDPGIGFTLLLCGPTKMHRPRGITRPIPVLTARIATNEKVAFSKRGGRNGRSDLLEVWRIPLDHLGRRLSRCIVRKGGIRACRRDRFVRDPHEILVVPPEFCEARGSLILRNVVAVRKLGFEPSKEPDLLQLGYGRQWR